MNELDRALIDVYGTVIENDIEIIKDKISIVIAAHCYTCIANRLNVELLITQLNM